MAEIRFHLDEHVAAAIAIGLRAQGIDVSTTLEANLSGANDIDQMNHAIRQGRVLVSHDDDYTRLHADGATHAGICYCHQQKYQVGDLLRALLLVHGCMTAEEMLNHIEYL